MGIKALVGVIGGYLGVISTILGTMLGIMASILVVRSGGICVFFCCSILLLWALQWHSI